MVGTWRAIYSLCGWEYDNSPSKETLRVRAEMLIQIRKNRMRLKITCPKLYITQRRPKKFKRKIKK